MASSRLWFSCVALVSTILLLTLPTMTSYSRHGVEAAVRLAAIKDPVVWERVITQYKPMVLEKKGTELVAMDDWCESLSTKLQNDAVTCISKDDLIKIIQWKFAKGKPRPYMKSISANTDKEVKECSKMAFVEAQDGSVNNAFDEICKLKGVGIAGASAILSLCRPDLVAFMDDEVIESLCTGKRGYTKAIYNAMNEKCIALSNDLGDGWTPRKVGMALWTAARICACGGEDLTLGENKCSDDDSMSDPTPKQRVKRRKI